jgi:WD40 repeat protein
VAACDWEGKAHVWSMKKTSSMSTSKPTISKEAIKETESPLLGLEWNTDSNKIFLASTDSSIHLWDLESNTNQVIGKVSRTMII